MLIAATAAEAESVLLTEDSLLQRHVASQLGADIFLDNTVLRTDFAPGITRVREITRESKGYINRN